MHALLVRQLRRCYGSVENVPPECAALLALVDQAYRQADDDRALIEHSMDTVSDELLAKNEQVERALALLASTFESSGDGLLVVDASGRTVRMNRKFVDLWRLPQDVVERRDDGRMLDVILARLQDPDAFVRAVRELAAAPEMDGFDVLRLTDGRIYERHSQPHRVNGEIIGRVWSFRDVTKRSELEGQLRQSQKLEAIGLLAGGIAHDFNNLLTVICVNTELVLTQSNLEATQRDDLQDVYDAAGRASELTKQLLAFGRKQILHPTPLDIDSVVRHMLTMLRRLISEDIEIVTRLDSGCIVVADSGQLEQVLMNLCVNARDAMPEGGRLTIETRERVVGIAEAISDLAPGTYAALTVRDSGQGIPPNVMSRIFEPFFTTKPAGKGTGLGLATVYGIIKQSGGSIDVSSELGMGTCFTLYIPTHANDAEPQHRHTPMHRRGSGETILVVEDENAVRRLIVRALEPRGFIVLPAATGAEALAIIESRHRDIDLVLTDVVMPAISGPELVEELRRRGHAELPVIYMSGYTEDEVIRRGVVQNDVALLQKPFTTDVLVNAVFDSLRGARQVSGRR